MDPTPTPTVHPTLNPTETPSSVPTTPSNQPTQMPTGDDDDDSTSDELERASARNSGIENNLNEANGSEIVWIIKFSETTMINIWIMIIVIIMVSTIYALIKYFRFK
eukprot:167836_1